MRLPAGMTIHEIATEYGNDWKPPSLGHTNEIAKALKEQFPHAQHLQNESVVETEFTYVRLNYSDRNGNGVVESIGVTSNGDEDSIAIIKAVCDRLDLRMVDHQTGEIADFEKEPRKSLEEYRAFCDRAREQIRRDGGQ